MQQFINEKLDSVRRKALATFGERVIGMYVIGSIVREATKTSDLDVLILFEDEFYGHNFDSIRLKSRLIAAEINSQMPEHELVIWASKKDHYLCAFPDVSYVRANLPESAERLDAWCGLAKHTLINYEASTCNILYGNTSIPAHFKKIPVSEAFELFLIAIRCFAQGIVEFADGDSGIAKMGANHVAKAGLRAAYATSIITERKPLNSYKDIHSFSRDAFPERFKSLLDHLLSVKLDIEPLKWDEELLVAFFGFCEQKIAGVARPRMSGLTRASAGESFAFKPESLFQEISDPKTYSRFSGFKTHYLHSLYFLMTAQEIVKRLSQLPECGPFVIDLFFEELSIATTFAIHNPQGVKIVLGRSERDQVNLRLGIDWLRQIAPILFALGNTYLAKNELKELEWLSGKERFARLGLLLQQAAIIPELGTLRDLANRFGNRISASDLLHAVEWQCSLVAEMFGSGVIKTVSQLGLVLYQAGQVDAAERILGALLRVENISNEGKAECRFDDSQTRDFNCALSTAFQYHAVTLHQKGDIAKAKIEYLRALDLDPENYSALDDLTCLLIERESPDEAVRCLTRRLNNFKDKKTQALEQVANRFMAKAIGLKKSQKYRPAEYWYGQAIAVNPGYEKPYFNLGLLFESKGELTEAAKWYKKAIEVKHDYCAPYVQLALIQERSGCLHEAVETLEAILRTGNADAVAYANLGNCYWNLTRVAAAKASYKKALEKNPMHADALNGMGIVLLEEAGASNAETIVNALSFFSKAVEADPSFDGAKLNAIRAMTMLKLLSD